MISPTTSRARCCADAAPPERPRPVHGEPTRAADPRGAVRGGVADEGSADQRHPLLSRSRRVHVLEERVIPRLFEVKRADDQIRVWVPACATGEEAYSVAMLLAEYAEGVNERPHIQVFATDLDEQAIAMARDGHYSEAAVMDMPEKRLERFFHKESTGYQIRRELRETDAVRPSQRHQGSAVLTSRSDLVPESADLSESHRQERILETFHFALRPSALLMLGPSESPDGSADLFAAVDERGASLPKPPGRAPAGAARRADPCRADPTPAPRAPSDRAIRADRRPSPPARGIRAAVAGRHRGHAIVHMSAAGRQISSDRGRRAIARSDETDPSGTARRAADGTVSGAKNRTAVEISNVVVTLDGESSRVDLIVRPVLREDDPARGFFLVLFADSDSQDDEGRTIRPIDPPEPLAQQLEEELTRVKTQLRTTIEQYEAQVEEAQAPPRNTRR